MKPSAIILFCLLIVGDSATAQKSNKPELHITASLDFASYYGDPLGGFGSHLKLIWPVGQKNNALVATVGFDKLFKGFSFDDYNYTFGLTSFGYRKGFKSAFIEPRQDLVLPMITTTPPIVALSV